MKRFFRFTFYCFLFSAAVVHSQNSESKNAKLENEQEEPIMFKFEPNYETARLQQREALLLKIKALDSLNLSDKQRLRMVKQIYRDSQIDKVQKTILVNTEFEEDDYQ